MSRKRKLNRKKPLHQNKSNRPIIGRFKGDFLTANHCAGFASGEELRSLVMEVMSSQVQQLEYILGNGLKDNPFLEILKEFNKIGEVLHALPSNGLEYFRTLLLDNTPLAEAVEISRLLSDRDLQDDYDSLVV